jgi:transglutaminase-like putative cysteine protease
MRYWLARIVAGTLVALLFPAALSFAEEQSVLFKNYSINTTVHPDGLFESVVHVELQATNDSAAKEIAQQPVSFSDSLQQIELVEAYTLKADGRRLPVDTKAIFPQSPPGATQIPMFNDQKLLMVVFPDVSGGDTVVYTANFKQIKPYFPGQFTLTFLFPKTITYKDFTATVTMPKSMPFYTDGVSLNKKSNKDTVEYKWTYASADTAVDDVAAISPFDRLPRFSASTFRNYEAIGRAYAALAGSKIVVSPRVQSQADEITAGITDRRQQARAVYEWVSRHIRYVAIFLNNGGLLPHDPDTILTNGYGDCKDHTVLFASLLKAKGIASEIVMINSDNAYSLPDVGVLGPLNHLISWLPEFETYADTTAGVAPFGFLPITEYGKPVVHAVSKGKVLRATPVLPTGAFDERVETTAKLGSDGKITGATVTSALGVPSVFLRGVALQIQSAGSERAAKAILKATGADGSGEFSVAPIADLAATYSLQGSFELEPEQQILSGERFAPPVGLKVFDRPGATLMGAATLLDLKDSDPTPCFSGHQVEILTLDLPPGKRIAKLPPGQDIKTDNLQFTSRWEAEGPQIRVRREFTSSIEEPLCTGRVRAATAEALKQIRNDYRTVVWLNAP